MKCIFLFIVVTFLSITDAAIHAQEKPVSLINNTPNANFILLRVKNIDDLKKASRDYPLLKLLATENNAKFVDRLILLYWHLQYKGALLNVGDAVSQGQVIGISGNSGYTYFPHLHFIVWKYDKKGQWTQIGTRFQTSKGIRYLRPFRFYRNTDQTK